jgi:hypothetical protein
MSEPKKSKVWAYGLTVFYVCFVLTVISACVILGKKRFDLVSADYYAEEIAYQDRIDSESRTKGLAGQPVFTVINHETVNVQFPAALIERVEQGDIVLYRPSDARKDMKVALSLAETGMQTVTLETPLRGLWSARVSWSMEGETYYHEQAVILPEMVTASTEK